VSSLSHAISNMPRSRSRSSRYKMDIVTYTTTDGAAHEFDVLEFLAALSTHIPKPYESLTRYCGRYSYRRRGEQAKLTPPRDDATESDYKREFRNSAWAACIKRIYEIDPLECPRCKAQMRIIAFIQDEHSIKDIMKSQGIADFRAPPQILRFSSTPLTLSMNYPPTTPLSPHQMTSKFRHLVYGTGVVYVNCYFL